MTRWVVEHYWRLRALRDNTTRLMYRHRVRAYSELELRWLFGDR